MPTVLARLAAWLAARKPSQWYPLAALLAAALALPSLGLGFMLDDFTHRYAVQGHPGPMSRFDLFSFATGDPAALAPFIARGPFPWWTDPELRLRLFRPLSSLLVQLDDALFGDVAWPYHVHSLAWSVAFVLAGVFVLRRFFSGAVLGAAVLLFAFDDARWMPTAWLANRNALVAGTFGLLAVGLHLRWRREGLRLGWLGSALCLALALCGGEAALMAVGFVVAFEVTAPRREWRALVPLFSVLAPYFTLYRALHLGAKGSGVYLDPLSDPAAFLAAAPARFAALVGNLLANTPIDLWLTAPQAVPALTAVGAVLGAGAAYGLWRLRGGLEADARRTLDTLTLGTLLGLGPSLATFPATRLLMIPALGAAGVLALVLQAAWRRRHTALVTALLVVHVGLATAQWGLGQSFMTTVSRSSVRAFEETELPRDLKGLRVVALTTGDAPTFIYLPLMFAVRGSALPESWWIVSHAPKAHRLTRTSDRAFELEVVDGRFLDTVFEQVVRTPLRPFHPGDVVRLDGGGVEVLEVDGWAPKRIRLTLDRPLDAPEVRVVAWLRGGMRQVALPPVGETLELPYSPGVMARAAGVEER